MMDKETEPGQLSSMDRLRHLRDSYPDEVPKNVVNSEDSDKSEARRTWFQAVIATLEEALKDFGLEHRDEINIQLKAYRFIHSVTSPQYQEKELTESTNVAYARGVINLVTGDDPESYFDPYARIHNDPEQESMNNFHGHMPDGFYRPSHKKGFLSKTMRENLAKFASFIDEDEDRWPDGTDHELVKQVKTKRDIQREVDRILSEDDELRELWEERKDLFGGGGITEDREYVLRPIYIQLREKFSEQDLSS